MGIVSLLTGLIAYAPVKTPVFSLLSAVRVMSDFRAAASTYRATSPRNSLVDDASLVTRQNLLRRLARAHVETLFLSEPRWGGAFEEGALEVRHIYSGDVTTVADVALLAYSTPRTRNDELAAPLMRAGIELRLVGDCLSPRDMLAATADGHAAGNAL